MAEIGVNPDLTQWNDAQVQALKKLAGELNGQDPTPAQASKFRQDWDNLATSGVTYTTTVKVADVTAGTAKAKISTAPKAATLSAASVTAVTSATTT